MKEKTKQYKKLFQEILGEISIEELIGNFELRETINNVHRALSLEEGVNV